MIPYKINTFTVEFIPWNGGYSVIELPKHYRFATNGFIIDKLKGYEIYDMVEN